MPFPGLQTSVGGEVVKLWAGQLEDATGDPGRVLSADTAGVVVACGEQAMRFTTLQKAGGRRLPAGDFLRGFPLAVGDRFASSGD